jgi:hypothetical protein
MPSVDPILLLKDHIQNNKKIERTGSYLIFSDGTKMKIDTPTAVVQSQTNKQYTIGSLWFYLKHRNDPLPTYIKECQKEKIDTIVSLDKGNFII